MVISKIVVSSILVFSVLILLTFTNSMGEKNEPANELFKDATCSDCHICFTPSKKDPCLRICPRLSKKITKRIPEEGPEVVILNQLEDLFEPVIFNHKLHAQMEEMGEGCVACHHYTPPGHIPPCRECHGGPLNPVDLRQPGLKGAYHRQCIGCHREWSHSTACEVCHLKKASGVSTARHIDTTDIIGIQHPHITVPEKWIYQTNYREGPAVIFHHREHVDLFGLKCVTCHKEENCSNCHDLNKNSDHVAKTPEEHHKPCISCHSMKRCQICHTGGGAEFFDHARTGWPLNRYHQELKCRKCHLSGEETSKPDTGCSACHQNWSVQTFDHSATGLALDETHKEMDCSDCHIDLKFEEKPSCASCHDDSRAYPQSSPGTLKERRL